MDALLGRETLAGLGDDASDTGRRLEASFGYGVPALGGRMTATPELTFGLGESGRDLRAGVRLGRASDRSGSVETVLEATLREDRDGGSAEGGVQLRVKARF